MIYEDWDENEGHWHYYRSSTERSLDLNACIYTSSNGTTRLVIYEDYNFSRINIILEKFFKDINNPTQNELRMFELRYGIDLSEPLGVKK